VLCALSFLLLSTAVTSSRLARAQSASSATSFVYTVWLKRRSTQNIVIGGGAGANTPLVGWAAVTGDVAGMSILPLRDHLLLDAAHFWRCRC